MTPFSGWPDLVFAALSILIAAYFAAQLVRTWPSRDAIALSGHATHLVMALGMAAMFAPALDPFPRTMWLVLFVLAGAWSLSALPHVAAAPGGLWGSGRRHHLHAVVSCAAMVVMLTSIDPPAGAAASGEHVHGGSGGSATPLLALFALYFVGHAALSGVSVVGAGKRLSGGSHLVMGLGMGAMFASMVVARATFA